MINVYLQSLRPHLRKFLKEKVTPADPTQPIEIHSYDNTTKTS